MAEEHSREVLNELAVFSDHDPQDPLPQPHCDAADGSVGLPAGRASRELLREMTDEAMIQLAQVLAPEMRGDYADADPTKHRWLRFLDEEVS